MYPRKKKEKNWKNGVGSASMNPFLFGNKSNTIYLTGGGRQDSPVQWNHTQILRTVIFLIPGSGFGCLNVTIRILNIRTLGSGALSHIVGPLSPLEPNLDLFKFQSRIRIYRFDFVSLLALGLCNIFSSSSKLKPWISTYPSRYSPLW